MQATRLFTRCSSSRFLKQCNRLPIEKLEMVWDLQFGGLLNLNFKEIRHNICLWLIDHFNVGFRRINISSDKSYDLTVADVGLVFGLSTIRQILQIASTHLIIRSVHSTLVRRDSSTYLSGRSSVDASFTTHVWRYWRQPQG